MSHMCQALADLPVHWFKRIHGQEEHLVRSILVRSICSYSNSLANSLPGDLRMLSSIESNLICKKAIYVLDKYPVRWGSINDPEA
jgi:hypothetical protein